ncbi:DSBA oxidoreductase [Frankia canadensis]|uniref:DSBA oxidoreductase n=1 Tax=Frankia canadensis TaxID=1836972 RepID=A0A2I2KJN6_9ACTN|nr:DHA2 family efflux MFS transporter permease subunit [Frankia canadensis]SNQ45866.1 DSBA oxidoreductase [Frankia canadensis]SOU53156.1 DSBA oxidoreductase [Frankia canadensis]
MTNFCGPARPRPRVTPRAAAATAYVTSLFMAALDTHIVNVMLPTLGRDFDAPLASVKWTVIGYILALAITMPAAAWLTGRFGERRVFVTALGLFVLASAACGMARSLPELIAVRGLQGAAGGLIGPVGTAMLYRAYPQSERARMTRLLLMPIALGPALAPPLGGLLVDHLSWRLAFFLNAPIGLVTAAMVLLAPAAAEQRQRVRLGAGNFATAAVGLSGALYVLGEGPELGWTHPITLSVAVVTIVAVRLFVAIELRAREPLIDLGLFRDSLFRYSNLATAFQTMAFLGGMLYITPLMLQQAAGRSPLIAGLVLAVVPVGVVISSQTVGRAFDVLGPRVLVVVGQSLLAVDLVVLSRFDGDTPLWAFCAAMLVAGLVNGMAMVGLQASMFGNIGADEISRAAAALTMNRHVSTALGVGLVTAVLSASAVTAAGGAPGAGRFQVAYLVAAACSAAAAVAAIELPRSMRTANATVPDAGQLKGVTETARQA